MIIFEFDNKSKDAGRRKNLLPPSWVLLDIERQKVEKGKWKLSEIAFVHAKGEEHYRDPNRTTLNSVLDRIEQAEVIVGHNIRRHDIPKLYKYAKRQQPVELDAKICDTLELSSLFLIGQPNHKLKKLYSRQLGLNNPLEDAWESYWLYKNIYEHCSHLPSILHYWAWRLLPKGYPRDLIPQRLSPVDESEWNSLQQNHPQLNIQALQSYLEGLPRQTESLGAIIFLNWLYQLNEPLARRPAWLEQKLSSFFEAEERACSLPLDKDKLIDELQYFYGFEGFRDGQLEIVQALLKGKTVPLSLLPTGGGKSLTFQLPALIFSRYRRGLSIIVSPLQALMVDQVESLKETLCKQQLPECAERVELLAGTQCLEEQRRVIDAVWNGQVDILYLSPERLRQPTIQRILKHRLPHLWVLDEAHTLSQWGHDFRPDFLRIAKTLERFYKKHQDSSICWGFVTATATCKTIEDLEHTVKKLDGLCPTSLERLPVGAKSFQWRNEIRTHVLEVERSESLDRLADSKRFRKTVEYLANKRNLGVAIVYVPTRRMAQRYAEELNKESFKVKHFHSRISDKNQVLEDFKQGNLEVVVATNAFGMGIDREGIHTVIHIAPPATPEAYLQEIGRLARKKGEQGTAYLFWHSDDFDWIFEQEMRDRISFHALQSCWNVIRPRLRKGTIQEAWVSALDLAQPLSQEDPEILATQARVAIYYLEKAGLIREAESYPCYLFIHLKRELNREEINKLNGDSNKLGTFLFDIGLRSSQEGIKLDVREVALATTISPSAIVKAVRQLVSFGLADWEYKVAFKLENKSKDRLKQSLLSTKSFLHWLQVESPIIDEKLSVLLHVDAVEEKLEKEARLNDALRLLKELKLVHYTKESRGTIRLFLKQEENLTRWLNTASSNLESQWQELDSVQKILVRLYEQEGWKQEESQLLDLAILENLLGTHGYQVSNLWTVLALMQRLKLVILGRGDLACEMLYRLLPGKDEEGKERKNWYANAYKPLEEHYAQRERRIQVMRYMLQVETEQERIQMLQDYFTLFLDEFVARYESVLQSPPVVVKILKDLNPTQKLLVTDDRSRALLALAGPGSGKTHTIVSRVAYLVSARGVPPERILVLAYNRTAAAEVRKRLYQLLGSRGTQVDALTFHALAAKLTKLKSRDLPKEIRSDERFDWLLEQAIAHLKVKENHPGYQYILVDEYQDVNELQYQIITLLAGFDRQDEDETQKSFLMAVGDDDQNLFEWNGARVEFIRRFRQDYQVPEEAVIPLVQNYRSRPIIVDFANRFIESALAAQNRLKGVNERIQAVNIQQPGRISWGEYYHPYHAAEWVADKIVQILNQTSTSAEKIAVLTQRWDDLRFIQYALSQRKISYQLYSTKDDLRPGNSRVGRAIIQFLWENPGLRVADPKAHLEAIRQNLRYSDRDAAWSALLNTLEGCDGITQEEMAYRLEEARPLRLGRIILSTFHTAKGSEFSHVFVLEDGLVERNRLDTHARELYVGFTRAKEELHILVRQQGHPALQPLLNTMNSPHLEKVEIPKVQIPQKIQYQWHLQPEDLFLSKNSVILAAGRQRIESYALRWGRLNIDCDQIQSNDLMWKGAVAVLSEKGKQKFQKYLSCGNNIVGEGYTVFRVERDDSFYSFAGYQGKEDHHYVVLPRFEVKEDLIQF